VQVARLAGMPAAVVRQARSALEALEATAQAGAAQIDLFAAAPAPAEAAAEAQVHAPAEDLHAPSATATALAAALAEIDPDSLSPREALAALYRLKGLSREEP
jgi:DNA mismatch repair protein MutS